MTDKKKGTLTEKIISAYVGFNVINTGIEGVTLTHDLTEKFGNAGQKYVGSVGAGIIEFGWPVLAGAAYLGLAALATVATYEFLTKKSQ